MNQLEDQTSFTFVEKNANQQAPSATLTSALYSIIFSHTNSNNYKNNKSSLTNQQQQVSTTTFPNDLGIKLKQNSRSKSQHNLITSLGEARNNNNKTSHLRASSSSIRHSKANFGLDDWFIRSESDCNLVLDYDSEFESDGQQSASLSYPKSVNFDNSPEIKLFSRSSQEKEEEDDDDEASLSSYSEDTQPVKSLSSDIIESEDRIRDRSSPEEAATITTNSNHLSGIVHYKSHSNNSSRTSIDNSFYSSWDQESRLTTSLSNSSSSTGKSCNFITKQQLNDINYGSPLQTVRNNPDNLKCLIDNRENTLEKVLLNDESEEEDWVFVVIEDKPNFSSATIEQSTTETSKSIIKAEDQSVSKLTDEQKQPEKRQQPLLSSLYNLRVNNSQYDNYIKLYKNLLKDEFIGDIDLTHFQIMALNMKEIDLIRESWKPVRQDIVMHGIQLFRDLFTKFPSYKQYFTNIPDLDLERMHENKRLLRHATKVIETVTFVVDSIGHESKANDLNEALLSLVKGHLKRKIGTIEFKNLGIVLVDFICNVNNQRGYRKKPDWKEESSASASTLLLSSSSSSKNDNNGGDKSASTNAHGDDDDDTATMTDALDKLRKLSSSAASLSAADDHAIQSRGATERSSTSSTTSAASVDISSSLSSNLNNDERCKINSSNELSSSNTTTAGSCSKIQTEALDDGKHGSTAEADGRIPLNTNSLVAAWTKLYGVILGLVEREETLLQEQSQPAFEAAN